MSFSLEPEMCEHMVFLVNHKMSLEKYLFFIEIQAFCFCTWKHLSFLISGFQIASE